MAKAPYIRYELAFNGEEQGVGFITGLAETGIDEDEIEKLLLSFNLYLPFPPYRDWESKLNSSHFPGAYFTQEGCSYFESDIHAIIEAVKYRDNGWEVIEIHSYGFPKEDLYYEDEYQVIVKTSHSTDDSADEVAS